MSGEVWGLESAGPNLWTQEVEEALYLHPAV
jgi:hypothetical protein